MTILMLCCAFISFIEMVRRQILNKPGWLINKTSISQANFISLICWGLCVSAAQTQTNFYTWRFFWRKKNPQISDEFFPDTVRSKRKKYIRNKTKTPKHFLLSAANTRPTPGTLTLAINSSLLWGAAPSCTGKSWEKLISTATLPWGLWALSLHCHPHCSTPAGTGKGIQRDQRG